MAEFENYRSFETEESAEAALGKLLEDAEIPYHISTVTKDNDLMFAKSGALMNVWLQLYPEDFDKVNKLLEQGAYDTVTLDKGHFLNSFTEQELRDVVYKADEWNAEDYVMARKILESRGVHFTDENLNALRAKRLNEIRKPRKAEEWLVICGFAVALLGGVLSVIIGWGLYTSTNIDPTGKKYYEYDHSSRMIGKDMMLLGGFIFVVNIILLFMFVTF